MRVIKMSTKLIFLLFTMNIRLNYYLDEADGYEDLLLKSDSDEENLFGEESRKKIKK